MADLPPPSYDDAITGNYSAPRPNPSSSPPPESSPSPERYRMTELAPSAPSLSEREAMIFSTEVVQQESIENDLNSEPELSQQGFCKRHLVTVWKLLIICALVGLLALFYLMFISPGTSILPSTPAVSKNCPNGPPNFQKGSYEWCGSYHYNHGARCELKCDKNYLFHIEDSYYTGPVYFECSNSEWMSPASIPCTSPDLHRYGTERTCGRCIQRPRGPNDCTGSPPNIYEGRYYDCLNKDDTGSNTHLYFEGESCNFRCFADGVIERPKGKCLNDGLLTAKKQIGLPRCSELEVPYETSGTYTCRRGKWVSSFPEIRGTNKTVECKPPSFTNCGNEPPQISKAKWIDCQQRRPYKNGDKCTFRCDFDYVLSSNKMVMDGNYDRVGYYTCTEGEWKSPHDSDESYGNLDCVTITQLVKQNIG